MAKFSYVDGDDWNGLYKDGKLIWQGHNITTYRLLELIGAEVDYKEADGDWLMDRGDLPVKLEDVTEVE